MRILVTGHRGNVGAPVARHLADLGYDVAGFDRVDIAATKPSLDTAARLAPEVPVRDPRPATGQTPGGHSLTARQPKLSSAGGPATTGPAVASAPDRTCGSSGVARSPCLGALLPSRKAQPWQ